MQKNNLLKNIFNKSDIGGINWVNPLVCLIFLISLIYVAFYSQTEKNRLSILLYILIFTLFIIAIILLTNWITLLRIKKLILKNNEKIVIHVFGLYIFHKMSLDNLIFNDTLLKYLIDVLVVLTSNNNIYITPTVNYTKQPLMIIPLNTIKNIEVSNIHISRLKVSDWSSAYVAANTGIAVNQIQAELDSKLPINKIYCDFKTDTAAYGLLLPKNENSIKFIRMVSGK
jgi:hypothetical protein